MFLYRDLRGRFAAKGLGGEGERASLLGEQRNFGRESMLGINSRPGPNPRERFAPSLDAHVSSHLPWVSPLVCLRTFPKSLSVAYTGKLRLVKSPTTTLLKWIVFAELSSAIAWSRLSMDWI